jgi:hypothetical protein
LRLDNYDNTAVIPVEYERLEAVLQIRDDCLIEKKKNLKWNFLSREHSSEDEQA